MNDHQLPPDAEGGIILDTFDVPVIDPITNARTDLGGKHARIRDLIEGRWTTVAEISRVTGMSAANVTGRIRELRKDQYGAYDVQVRRTDLTGYEYTIERQRREYPTF
jgi:hypothetical protein